MEKNNDLRGLQITGQGEDVGGKFYTVTLLEVGRMSADGRVYNGDIAHLIRGIKRQPRVFCEVNTYHDYRFQIPTADDNHVVAVSTIDMKNVCATIENIRHDKVKGAVKAELRPFGPHAKMVTAMMDERNQNLKFGMRALATPQGAIDKVICWDLLLE